MSSYEPTKTAALVALHEGFRQFPYHCTADKLTIGHGFNLDDVGLSEEESLVILNMRLERIRHKLQERVPNFHRMSSARQAVLVDMCYNLGWTGLKRFLKMWRAINDGAWSVAADEMLDSRWARQVGQRATRLSKMMHTGEWPHEWPYEKEELPL